MNEKLKYLGYSIVFQEVPDEVSLAINISGCPHRCGGCHSKYLWEYEGDYISDDIINIIEKYKELITCVCFMGGEQNPIELENLLKIVHSYKLKTALYTGCDLFQDLSIHILANLDYLKMGHYEERYGGLNSKISNQKMYKWDWNNNNWNDITYKFMERGLVNES